MQDPLVTITKLLEAITLKKGEGVALHYDCDTDAGVWAIDRSNGNHNGALNNVAFVASKSGFGTALTFGGTNSAVLTTAKRKNLNIKDEFTVEAWVKPTDIDQTWQAVLGDWGSEGDGRSAWLGISDADKIVGYVHLNGAQYMVDSGITAVNDTWYHIVLTMKIGDGLRIYVDGDLKATNQFPTTTAFSDTQPSQSFSIGCRGDYTDWFAGLIDEVRIYHKQLSDAEVLANYTDAPIVLEDADIHVAEEYDDVLLKHHDGVFAITLTTPSREQTLNFGGDKLVSEGYLAGFWTRDSSNVVARWLRWKAMEAVRLKIGPYHSTSIEGIRSMNVSVPQMGKNILTQPPTIWASFIIATRRIVSKTGEPI